MKNCLEQITGGFGIQFRTDFEKVVDSSFAFNNNQCTQILLRERNTTLAEFINDTGLFTKREIGKNGLRPT